MFIVAILVSCGRKNGAGEGKRIVTVTIEPLRYITECIAGDKFEVKTMVPDGSNPETYEPSARQMISLAHSDLYIKVGTIGFERTWMKRLQDSAPHVIVVDSSDGIDAIKEERSVSDPHIWMSPSNAIVMAGNIYRALAGINGKDRLYFKKNLEQFCEKVNAIDKEIRTMMSEKRPSSFLIYHPILTYFARDYGLNQISLEEEGHEPSARQIEYVITRAKRENVRVFLVQKAFAGRSTDIVARTIGARKVEINPLGYDWPEEIINIARSLK